VKAPSIRLGQAARSALILLWLGSLLPSRMQAGDIEFGVPVYDRLFGDGATSNRINVVILDSPVKSASLRANQW